MKYKATVEFNGISITNTDKKDPVNINIPGNITVHAEGEYSWLDIVVFGWLLKRFTK